MGHIHRKEVERNLALLGTTMSKQICREFLEPGSLFAGRYLVRRRLNAGGMGIVYEVLDIRTERRRALKLMNHALQTRESSRRRFINEGTISAKVRCGHVVEVLDAGVEGVTGALFLVMELLSGRDLARHIRREGPLSIESALALLNQAACALDKTHARMIVHRDLKPENLFITKREDGSAKLKVLDFGIAKVLDGTQITHSSMLGTAVYMSPEQVRGEGVLSTRSDLYSLAHVTYALLTGEAYWQEELERGATIFAVLLAVMKGAKELPSERALRRRKITLPRGFDAWFQRSTHLDPVCRFASAGEQIQALSVACGLSLNRCQFTFRKRRAQQRSASFGATLAGRFTVAVGIAALAVLAFLYEGKEVNSMKRIDRAVGESSLERHSFVEPKRGSFKAIPGGPSG